MSMGWQQVGAVGVLGALLFAAGCGTVSAPVAADRPWTPPASVTNETWPNPTWAEVRDRIADLGRPLSLTELVELAVRHSPDVRRAWEDARAAEALKTKAASAYYPKLTVSGTATRQKQGGDTATPAGDLLTYGPAAQLTWLVLDLGGRGAAVEQAAQGLIQANFQFNRTIQDVLLAVEKAYFGLHAAQQGVVAATSSVAEAATILEAARQKEAVGLGTRVDVLQAEAGYFQALYNLEEARGQVRTAQASLAQTVGVSPAAPLEIVAPLKEPPRDIPEADLALLIEDALRLRPDLAASRAALRAKEAAVTAASSELWPSLSLGGSAQQNWNRFDDAALQDNDGYQFAGYATLSWNILDGFSSLAAKWAAQAQAASARAQLQREELAAAADVWSRYYDYLTANRKFSAGQSAYDSARASYDLALQSYEAGLTSFTDLLASQTKLTQARFQWIQDREDALVALASLAHATGALVYEGGESSAAPVRPAPSTNRP
jgi:TolC family type I secretion outer membrane protein